jgi:hypothetical protein
MNANSLRVVVSGLLLVPWILIAQVPAGAPAGATGKCKDGTFTTTPTKQGACRGHKGVDAWYAASSASPKSSAAASSAAPALTPKAAPAAATGPAPSGATGKCKDGSFTTAPKKQGACRGHQGVETWYAAETAPVQASQKNSATTPASAATPALSPAASRAPAPASTPNQKSGTRTSASSKTPAPGGGPGLVWVNSSTNIYHCYGTQFYGTTKAGKYMSEADAKSAGARPDRNKACSAK